jgi:hypothetical protein
LEGFETGWAVMSREGKRKEEMFGEGRRGKKRMGIVAIKRLVKVELRRVRGCTLHHSVML